MHGDYLYSMSLLGLVDRIYEGAVAPRAWPDIVRETGALLEATKGRLFTPLTPPHKGGLSIAFGIEETALRQWGGKYREHNVWLHRARQKGLLSAGSAGRDTDLLSAAELGESVIYRDHLRPLDVGRLCFGVIFDASSPGVPMTVFCAYRSLENPFSEEAPRRLKALLPHFSRALRVMYRLRDAELGMAASRSALDALPIAVVLLGPEGKVLRANRAAVRLLEQSDGLLLQGAQRQWLEARDGNAHAALQVALGQALRPRAREASHSIGSVVIPRARGRRALAVHAAPLPEANPFSGEARLPRVVVFITDLDDQAVLEPALLRGLYGVTAAEARLAGVLVEGKSLAEAAAACGISLATAKSHVKRLYEKTGAGQQGDLVRRLGSLATRQRM